MPASDPPARILCEEHTVCGIAGLIDRSAPEDLAQVLGAMCSIQAYRGPDDEGIWQTRLTDGGVVGLGSRRDGGGDRSTGTYLYDWLPQAVPSR
jgi:hypothetical protein